MAPPPTPEHVRRLSAALAWALWLLVAGLSSLAHGSLHDGSFATTAGTDRAVAVSQRLLGSIAEEQQRTSSDGHPACLALATLPFIGHDTAGASAVVSVLVTPSRRHTSAQPRAPPHL